MNEVGEIKICYRCGTHANVIAVVCPACHAKLGGVGANGVAKKRTALGVKILAGLFGFFLVSVFIGMVANESSNSRSSAAQAVGAPEVLHQPQWQYSTYTTTAGSKTYKVGCLRSDDEVRLHWPYGTTYAKLCLRGNGDVLIALEGKGQILSGDRHGATIRIGGGPPRRFALSEPSDYSSDVVFIEPAGPLLSAAKSAKNMTVELTFYQDGEQTLTFSPAGPLVLSTK